MARKERKYHYIYKITCLKNNKYYIGMHSTDNMDDGYMGGGNRIKNSIKKHGKKAHSKEILGFYEDRESLRRREIELVNEELIRDPLCMNIQLGGGGGFTSDRHIEKAKRGASEWLKKQWETEGYREKISQASSSSMKNKHREGKIKYDTFKGGKHTEETKEKMRESSKGKGVGSANSQFGTRWITDGSTVRKIKKNEDLPYGWTYGRKI